MRPLMLAVVLCAAALVLSSCGFGSKSAWQHYDECAVQISSFVAMAECGRQKRLAACVPDNSCSGTGTALMQYADSLVLAVKNREMTEAEALRRFAEYKSQYFAGERRNDAIVAAGAAASPKSSGPTTCTRVGNSVSCY